MLCSVLQLSGLFLYFSVSHTEWLLGDLPLFSLELGHSFSELCLYDQMASVISVSLFGFWEEAVDWERLSQGAGGTGVCQLGSRRHLTRALTGSPADCPCFLSAPAAALCP